jgi:hypothetical protein
MSHNLAITKSVHWTPDEPDWDFTIKCLTPNTCNGWIECLGDHAGYDPEDEESPAFDQYEDVEIHGMLHKWYATNNWVIPFLGCVVDASEWIDDAREIARLEGLGTYRVAGEWGGYADDEFTLTNQGRETP